MLLHQQFRETEKLLCPADPRPVHLVTGWTPIIMMWPHYGTAVPGNPETPYGMSREEFKLAHIACDVHMQTFLKLLQLILPGIHHIAGTYSRLVVDLNRLHDTDDVFTPFHSETRQPISENQALSDEEKQQRLNEIYCPYHIILAELVQNVRTEYGDVILLDMHSFNGTWNGVSRDVDIGTLRHEETELSQILESVIRSNGFMRFVPGLPYDLTKEHKNASRMVSELTGTPYLGIEMNNDFLATHEGQMKMVRLLAGFVQRLSQNPRYSHVMRQTSSRLYNLHEPFVS